MRCAEISQKVKYIWTTNTEKYAPMHNQSGKDKLKTKSDITFY